MMKMTINPTILLTIISTLMGVISESIDKAEITDGKKSISVSATWTFTDPDSGKTIQFLVNILPPLPLSYAKAWCEDQSPTTRLISIETYSKLTFLRNNVKLFVAEVSTKYNSAAFWTAGTDLIVHSIRGQGQYWFYSGLNIDTNFWNSGEPNDNKVIIETCVDFKIPAANPRAEYSLNDEDCGSMLSYICETPIN